MQFTYSTFDKDYNINQIPKSLIKHMSSDNTTFISVSVNSALKMFDQLLTDTANDEVTDPKFHFAELLNIHNVVIGKMIKAIEDEVESIIEEELDEKEMHAEFLDFLITDLYSYLFYKENEISVEMPEELSLEEFGIMNYEEMNEKILNIIVEPCVDYGVEKGVFTKNGNTINLSPLSEK